MLHFLNLYWIAKPLWMIQIYDLLTEINRKNQFAPLCGGDKRIFYEHYCERMKKGECGIG